MELHKKMIADAAVQRYERFIAEQEALMVMNSKHFHGVMEFTNVTDVDCMRAYKAFLDALKSAVEQEIDKISLVK